MARVSIVSTTPGLQAALAEALDLVGGLGAYVGRGDRVLIKPNLNGAEGFTSPALTAALVQSLRAHGVRRVALAESTFGTAATTDRLFDETGYTQLARELDVPLINLNRSEAVEVAVPQPLALESIHIAREVLEADRLVNVPNLKVHYATGITAAMKNLKGVLVGGEKRRFHEVGLDRAIADLNCVVAPALNVVDAICGMERMGPRGGDPVELNLILAGAPAAAVDWVAAQVIGFQPAEIGHLSAYPERTGFDPASIVMAGEPVASVRRPFARARVEAIVPACFTVRDGGACSACMNAFLLSCQFLQGMPDREVEVLLGPRAAGSGGGAARIAFGTCCPPAAAAELRIAGCPPYPFDLEKALVRAGWSG
jgi:uncharacterized protein (DUF362 family)